MNLFVKTRGKNSSAQTIWSDGNIRIFSLDGIQTISTAQNTHIEDTEGPQSYHLLFCLCGKIEVRPPYIREGGYSVPEGYCNLACSKCERSGCDFQCLASGCGQGVLISLAASRLREILPGQGPYKNPGFLWEGSEAEKRVLPVTPIMYSALNRIQYPETLGEESGLFYLAKVLELLHEILASDSGGLRVDTTDSRIVRKTMSNLEARLDNPPSVAELAEENGISASKLKQLFPRVCGMPPYAYLRKLRMEKALDLLNKEGMNVTEVALEVGYESLSHFSKAFYRHHGLQPFQARKLGR